MLNNDLNLMANYNYNHLFISVCKSQQARQSESSLSCYNYDLILLIAITWGLKCWTVWQNKDENIIYCYHGIPSNEFKWCRMLCYKPLIFIFVRRGSTNFDVVFDSEVTFCWFLKTNNFLCSFCFSKKTNKQKQDLPITN